MTKFAVRPVVLATVALVSVVHAQAPAVTVVDVGPGPSGRIVRNALEKAHRLIEPDTSWFVLHRNQQESGTIVVLGRTAAIEGSVTGDVIVVGGDLFVRPAGRIGGRAVAIGGGVYPSALSIVSGGSESFRDNTFTITRTDAGYELRYQSLRVNPSRPLLFPAVYGFRMPTYDRVNGVSLPFGPELTFANGRGDVDALVVYRSDLGKIDPVLGGTFQLSRRFGVDARVGRETLTNDAWIWSNFVNSLSTLVYGTDTRNYFRADRAQLRVHDTWEWTHTQVEPYVGGRFERAWSVGPFFGETGSPWSITGRKDSLGMRRPNPAIMDGHIASVLGGTAFHWEAGGVTVNAETGAEVGLSAPADRRFVQLTSDLDATFLTFGDQQYDVDAHWVTTPSDVPPSQRFAYLGGAGTLPFEDLLDEGGDELLLIDQRYAYPLLNVTLGLFGSPTLLLRHRLASAGLTKLPAFGQLIGVGVMLTVVRVELQFDPNTRRKRFGIGLTFSR